MRLAYNDDAPEDYEPPYFQAGTETEPAHFSRNPFTMAVGSISTSFHAVSLHLKSVLDGNEEGDNEQPCVEEQGSITPSSNNTSLPTDDVNAHPMDVMEAIDEDETYAPSDTHPADCEEVSVQGGIVPGSSDANTPPLSLEDVKQYCLNRKEIDQDAAALYFNHLADSQLARAFNQLVLDGVLCKTKAHGYKVCAKASGEINEGTQNDNGRQELDDCTKEASKVRHGTSRRGPKQLKTGRQERNAGELSLGHLVPVSDARQWQPPQPVFDLQLRQQQGLDSEAGRAGVLSGDTASGQPEGGEKNVPAKLRELELHRPAENFVIASQESDWKNMKRKASFVAEPIHQKRRMMETRLRAKMQGMHK